VALGVGSIVAQSIALFTIVKLLGASYLAYLGIQAIRHRRAGLEAITEHQARPASSRTMLRQGFVVGATNPKTIVFFVAALPQFVDFDGGGVPIQMLVLGLVFTAIVLVFDGAGRCWPGRRGHGSLAHRGASPGSAPPAVGC
jgi:threonine/homoserine/homoserine lactone efflux protein